MVAVSEKIERLAAKACLAIGGMLWDGDDTIVLLIPQEPGFWTYFTASPEYADGMADPLDRWSKRVIKGIAQDLGAEAEFPSDGPPYPPFFSWALGSGQAWASPVQMLVHQQAGMMLSLRGALRLIGHVQLAPLSGKNPCRTCENSPCLTHCPVGALSAEQYDVAACQSYLRTTEGQRCMTQGCLARRACPASLKSGRLDAQSEFHMQAFTGDQKLSS